MHRDERDVKALWAAIADREARLLTLVKAFAQIVWVTDKDGKVLSDADPPPEIANLTWSAFTGLSQQSLSGSGWAAAVHPEDLPAIGSMIRSSQVTGAPIDAEFRIRHRSGEWRWVICRGSAVRTEEGEIAGWIGACTDITSAKKTEAAYRESQQRLLAALDAGEMSTWIWNIGDNTFWWDEAGEKLWGTSGRVSTHAIDELLQFVHADDRKALIAASNETVVTGVVRSVEFRTIRSDGKLQWLQSRGRVEKDAGGQPVRVIGAFVDVTKLKTAEDSLRQAQKMQALGTLAGGIAHDFNNLLLAISGNAQLALIDVDKSHPCHSSLREIAKASARASDLVRRILTFSARQPAAPAITPMHPAIIEALTLLRSSLPQNVNLRTHLDATAIRCTLGQAELQQVIVNLVSNAIHAIGEHDGSIDITVGIEQDEGYERPHLSPQPATGGGETAHSSLLVNERYARITVSDSGCGMDAATRARIFEPFFTTKPTGEGTGLGLAVVHGIVNGCGGAIAVASAPGSGTTFTLWLPLARDDAADPKAVVPATAAGGSGEHILYVDDDEAVVFLVRRLLDRAGYRVTCCEDPREAQRLFAERAADFDVVVTDLSMPFMSGFDLVLYLRTVRPGIPVVMTSGYVRDEDQARATTLGIGRIILKPHTVDELSRELDARCAQLRVKRLAGD